MFEITTNGEYPEITSEEQDELDEIIKSVKNRQSFLSINEELLCFKENIINSDDPNKELEEITLSISFMGEKVNICFQELIEFVGDNTGLFDINKAVILFSENIGLESEFLYGYLYELVFANSSIIDIDNFIKALLNSISELNISEIYKFSLLSKSEELYQKLKVWFKEYEGAENNYIEDFIEKVGNTSERKKELQKIYENTIR